MDVTSQPTVRGRLNQLVQMFENQSKSKNSSPVKREPAEKLSKSKLAAVHKTDQTASRRISPSLSSVGSLIKTFNAARPEEMSIPMAKQPTKQWSKERLRREERIPEVAAMIDEVFAGLECRTSLEPQRTSDNVFHETGSTTTDFADAESYASTESMGGCIGAMWSADDINAEMRQPCTLQLRAAIEKFGRPKDDILWSSEAWSASMQLLVSHADAVNADDALWSPDVSSVRTCKALIEMTVFVGESCKPTINVINRHPNPPFTSEDDEDVIFSTDRL